MDRLEVAKKPFLGRLVVIRADHQGGLGPGFSRMLGQADGLVGGIRPATGDDRHATGRRLNAEFGHMHVFFMGQCR